MFVTFMTHQIRCHFKIWQTSFREGSRYLKWMLPSPWKSVNVSRILSIIYTKRWSLSFVRWQANGIKSKNSSSSGCHFWSIIVEMFTFPCNCLLTCFWRPMGMKKFASDTLIGIAKKQTSLCIVWWWCQLMFQLIAYLFVVIWNVVNNSHGSVNHLTKN